MLARLKLTFQTVGKLYFNNMIHFKENWHKEIIPAGIWEIAVLVLLLLIYLK